jgi:hypothetical protein
MAAAQTDKDRTYFEKKCASLDRQIDALVYDLYADAVCNEGLCCTPGQLHYGSTGSLS